MGRELACAAVVNGERVQGRALLETDALVFRGDARLSIPLREVSDVQTERGRLTVNHPGGTAIFELGREAESWARRIRHPPTRQDKLGVKPGQRVVVLGVRDDGFVEELRARGALVSVGRRARDADVVFFGAARRADLRRLPELVDTLRPDGALWVVRPKGGGPITEADVLAAGRGAGLVDVKVVRFSDTHTAERFVVPAAARRR